ncbi:transposase [Halobacterium zhouii]|uniref:transposase n=1 Tax=Halobacterium zhouii TaxID=2902624 RepID=UPI001E362D27|nr:transposase [Halobacterium zhouii]
MSDPSDYPAQTRFQKAVRDLLESKPDAGILDITGRLDVPFRPDEDRREDPDYETEAVLRALFAKEVADWSFPELARRLANDPEAATALGFADGPPDQSSFWRYWESGYITDDLKASIKRKAGWTRNRARAENHPIGGSSLEPADAGGVSERTESRLIRERLRDVPREMVQLVADEWGYLPDRAQNLQYHRNAFLEMECAMGVRALAAEQGAEIYGDNTDRDSGGPTGDTHLHYIKQCDRDGIQRRAHNSIGLMVNQAKRHLEFDRPVDVAIDYTDVAYYGQDRDSKWVWDRTGYQDKDHDWAHRYASISIVGDNVRFVLGFLPVPEGKRPGAVVEELLGMAQAHVSIDTVYADRHFAATDIIRVLHEHRVNYVIPVPKNARIKRAIQRMSEDVAVKENYGFYGDQQGSGTRVRAETTLALVPATQSDADVTAFYTNEEVNDASAVERAETERVMNRYRRRWGIETQYRTLKTFLPWTTSNDPVVRLFHFAFGMLLYNLWRLIDFLIQQSIEVYETRSKPRVKAKRFINAVEARRLLT